MLSILSYVSRPLYVFLGEVSVQALCLLLNWVVCLPGVWSCELFVYCGDQTLVRGPDKLQSLEGPRGQLGQMLCRGKAEETLARVPCPQDSPGHCFPALQVLVPGPCGYFQSHPFLYYFGRTWSSEISQGQLHCFLRGFIPVSRSFNVHLFWKPYGPWHLS